MGIGTSAGGLEALEQFLRQVPAASGIAFVIVQHLDPDHKGMLPEILQRATPMPVCQARSGMKIAPDHVYVIPPNKDMSVAQGMLCLHVPSAPRGLRLPIDFFFSSLALAQQTQAIGVILSGMGADGTQGARIIKLHGGVVAAQEPASAKFDSMPRAAIAADVVDLVGTPSTLPEKILSRLRHGLPGQRAAGEPEPHQPGALEDILGQLRARIGRDFSVYKKSSISRRIERRMSVHQLKDLPDYARYVRNNPQELDLLFKELLIGVTSFFRDAPVWEHLKHQEFPAIFAAHPGGKTLRAWVAACSTGEEAYSLAITFREALQQAPPPGHFTLDIFATDLDPDAIHRARQGLYPASIAKDVTPERLRQFFIEEGGNYRISKSIREMITFAPQDIVQDSPFTRLDILCCRNVLIYFGAELHKKLVPLFHYALNPGGVLALGSAETVGNFTDLFSAVDSKARIYRRIDPAFRKAPIEFPLGTLPPPSVTLEKTRMQPTASLQSLADQILLQQFAPAAVLVNGKGDILYINGRTGKYLEPAAGKANWNVHAMAREELRGALAAAMYEASRKEDKVVVRGLRLADEPEGLAIDITVKSLAAPPTLQGMLMVAFTEVPAPAAKKEDPGVTLPMPHAHVADLQEALRQAQEENQAMREQMQATREELRSANEELQSNNEELQSTNEELTSSREEMQSMNEELQTINAELQSKVEDLSRASDDMKNLLDSTDIATVFLDNALNIRRFTNRTTQIFKLIAGDVGRPLSDIVSDLQYPEMAEDAREVLRTLVFSDKQICTSDGRWFKVRIMPYRTQDNVINGVVITFSDITAAKILEEQLRQEIETSGTPKTAMSSQPLP